MAVYNPSRLHDSILTKNSNSPPSFTINFYQEHWLINNSRPNLYHTPISFLLDNIRERRVPPDWLSAFDQHNVPFYDGCLIVELVDHRTTSTEEAPTKERVVLQMDAESLWSDIRLHQERTGKAMTDEEALDLEARILAATSPPLCLDPDTVVVRIANTALRAGALTAPAAFKKKDAAAENERDAAVKATRTKINSLMNPHKARTVHPMSRLLEFAEQNRMRVDYQRSHPVQPPPAAAPLPETASAIQPQPPHPQQLIQQQAIQAQMSVPMPVAAPVQVMQPATHPAQIQQKKKKPTMQIAMPLMPKQEDMHMQAQPPQAPHQQEQTDVEMVQPGSGQMKRKASITAQTPEAAKKKLKKGESAEPSPAPPPAQLPLMQQPHQPQMPPQSVAYQLPPSTNAAIPYPPPKKPNMQQPQKKAIPMQQMTQQQRQIFMAQQAQAAAAQNSQQAQHLALASQLQPGMQLGQPQVQRQPSPLPPPAHPTQEAKPATPLPNPNVMQIPPQIREMLQGRPVEQQRAFLHNWMMQQRRQQQQQQQGQEQQLTEAARAAAASPRPNQTAVMQQQQQQQQTPQQQPAPFPQSQFTFQHPSAATMNQAAAASRLNQMQVQQNAARMNSANLHLTGQGGQLNQNMMHQHMASMGLMPAQAQAQSPFQQQVHAVAASPQIGTRSPMPANAQAPSRPGSTLPPHGQQNAAVAMGQAGSSQMPMQYQNQAAMLQAAARQQHQQQQQQQQQQAQAQQQQQQQQQLQQLQAQHQYQQIMNQNYQLQQQMAGAGQTPMMMGAAQAQAQAQANWGMGMNPGMQRFTPQQQQAIQHRQMYLAMQQQRGGMQMPPGQGR